MGLREKITLTLVSAICFQITNSSCMPRSLRNASVKRFLNKNNNVLPTLPIRVMKKSDLYDHGNFRNNVNKQERSVYSIFGFPEVEYPLQSILREPFRYSYHESMDLNCPTKPTNSNQSNQTDISFLNKLRNGAKMKRKHDKHKNPNINKILTNEINNPEFKSTPDPYCFYNLGGFPEVEYPLSAKETWTQNYWKPFTFMLDNQHVNTNDNNYLQPQVVRKNIRTFLKPLTKSKETTKNKPKEELKNKHMTTQSKRNRNIVTGRKSAQRDKSNRYNAKVNYSKTTKKVKSLTPDILKIENVSSNCDNPKLAIKIPVADNEEITSILLSINVDNNTCLNNEVIPKVEEDEFESTSGMPSKYSMPRNHTNGDSGTSNDLNNLDHDNNTDEQFAKILTAISHYQTQELCHEPSWNNSFRNKFSEPYHLNNTNNKKMTDTPNIANTMHIKTTMNLVQKSNNHTLYDNYALPIEHFSMNNDSNLCILNDFVIPLENTSDITSLKIDRITHNLINNVLNASTYNIQSQTTRDILFSSIFTKPTNTSSSSQMASTNVPVSSVICSTTTSTPLPKDATSNNPATIYHLNTLTEGKLLNMDTVTEKLFPHGGKVSDTKVQSVVNKTITNPRSSIHKIPNSPVSDEVVTLDKYFPVSIDSLLDTLLNYTPNDNTLFSLQKLPNPSVLDVIYAPDTNLELPIDMITNMHISHIINEPTDTIQQTVVPQVFDIPNDNTPLVIIDNIPNIAEVYAPHKNIFMLIDTIPEIPISNAVEPPINNSLLLIEDPLLINYITNTHVSDVIREPDSNLALLTEAITETPISHAVEPPITNTPLLIEEEPDTFIKHVVDKVIKNSPLLIDGMPNPPISDEIYVHDKNLAMPIKPITDTPISYVIDEPIDTIQQTVVPEVFCTPNYNTPLTITDEIHNLWEVHAPHQNIFESIDTIPEIPTSHAVDRPINNALWLIEEELLLINDNTNPHVSDVIQEPDSNLALLTEAITETPISNVVSPPITNIPLLIKEEPDTSIKHVVDKLINNLPLLMHDIPNSSVSDEIYALDKNLDIPIKAITDMPISYVIGDTTDTILQIPVPQILDTPNYNTHYPIDEVLNLPEADAPHKTLFMPIDTVLETPKSHVVDSPIANVASLIDKEPDIYIHDVVGNTLSPLAKVLNIPVADVAHALDKSLPFLIEVIPDSAISYVVDIPNNNTYLSPESVDISSHHQPLRLGIQTPIPRMSNNPNTSSYLSFITISHIFNRPSNRTAITEITVSDRPTSFIDTNTVGTLLPVDVVMDKSTPIKTVNAKKALRKDAITDKHYYDYFNRTTLHSASLNTFTKTDNASVSFPLTVDTTIDIPNYSHIDITASMKWLLLDRATDIPSFCSNDNYIIMDTLHPQNTISSTYSNHVVPTTNAGIIMPVKSVGDIPIIDYIDTTTNTLLTPKDTSTEPYVLSSLSTEPAGIPVSVKRINDLPKSQKIADIIPNKHVSTIINSPTEVNKLPTETKSNTLIFRTIEEPAGLLWPIKTTLDTSNITDSPFDICGIILHTLNSTNISRPSYSHSSFFTDTISETVRDDILPFDRIDSKPVFDSILLPDLPTDNVISLNSELASYDTPSNKIILPEHRLYDTSIIKVYNTPFDENSCNPQTLDDPSNDIESTKDILPIFDVQVDKEPIKKNLNLETSFIPHSSTYDNPELFSTEPNTNEIIDTTSNIRYTIAPINSLAYTPTSDINNCSADESSIPQDIYSVTSIDIDDIEMFTEDYLLCLDKNYATKISFENVLHSLNSIQDVPNIVQEEMLSNYSLQATNIIVDPATSTLTNTLSDETLSLINLVPKQHTLDEIEQSYDYSFLSEAITEVPYFEIPENDYMLLPVINKT